MVTTTFDSDIFAASIDGNITVTSGGETVAISDVKVTGNVVTFTAVNPPEGDLTVTIDRFVRNLNSIPMAENYTKVFVKPVVKVSSITFDGTVTADSTVKATAVLESTLSEDKTVELIIAVKDSNGKLKLVNLDRQTITAGGTLTLEASVTLPADVTGLDVEAFVWENETLEPLTDKVNL